ncbi:MAG: ATP-binding cassette domain-containing protein [Candidatus Thermoplasmatota archaeon]
MPALWMSGIRKQFGRRDLWAPLDLTVEAGERVALLGANGSGKSTLLRIAATVSPATAGAVVVAGLDAKRNPEQARGKLSHLPQDAPCYAELTPHEHLRWWSRVQGVTVDPDAALVEAGLATMAHKPTSSLSRGQRQRLALAMALAPDRPLLILDEPFAALDADGVNALERQLTGRGSAMLIALHDEAQARRIAHRVLRLDAAGVRPT